MADHVKGQRPDFGDEPAPAAEQNAIAIAVQAEIDKRLGIIAEYEKTIFAMRANIKHNKKLIAQHRRLLAKLTPQAEAERRTGK